MSVPTQTEVGRMSVAELQRLALDQCRKIDAGVSTLASQSKAEAEAERDYRRSVAQAWVKIDRDGMLAAEADARVKAETSSERYRRDVARGMVVAAREAVRARRAVLSMCQTLLGLERAEAELAGYGPEVTP